MNNIIKNISSHENRIIGYDIIRFLAIFQVFWGHGQLLIPNELKSVYNFFAPLPLDGVSIFFVLSGFLIGNILYRTIINDTLSFSELFNFLQRRWYRTIPNYFFVLVLLLLLGARIDEFNLSFLVFSQNLFENQSNFFGVSWSLAVEEWFYLIFPLFLFTTLKFVKNKRKAILITILFFLLLPLILRIHNFNLISEYQLSSVRKITIFRLDSMMFGVLSAVIYSEYRTKWIKLSKTLALSGLGCLLLITLIIYLTDIYSSNFNQLVTLFYFDIIPVVLFLPLASQIKKIRFKKLNNIIVFISKISYSIYLVHASLVLWFIVRKLEETKFILEFRFELQRLILFIIYIALTLAFSILLYLFVETPFLKLREKVTKNI